MLEIDATQITDQLDAIIDELLSGTGAVALRGAFDAASVDLARSNIMDH